MTRKFVIGVDVGTGSARAGVFDASGQLLGSARADITLYREAGSIVEQSSNEIWEAVCTSVRAAVKVSQIDANQVVGIGFDATCSLVVLGEGGAPLPVGPSNDPLRDIIVWMDHRAVEQSERINATGHAVLKYVGGVISPEMETPKLLWLREKKPDVFDAAWQFFDLADFLTWRATGSLARSTCTVTCKWTFLSHENRWDDSYFRAIGLGVLADEDYCRIGTEVVPPGTKLGEGLSNRAATELGLVPGTSVGASLIDAHAGGIGTVGALGTNVDPTDCLAYVFGTSSCTMTSTKDPVFVPGIWGPYFSAMVPGLWLNEGGQSAAGAAIDQLLSLHPAAHEAQITAKAQGVSLPELLATKLAAVCKDPPDAVNFVGKLHVVPEFLGNRSPFADPHARAIISGLDMANDLNSLISHYVAGICGLGYGLRQIIETQGANGVHINSIVISGGAGKHPIVRQLIADATGVTVVGTSSDEPVLLGAAMLGAVASGLFPEITDAMQAMSGQSGDHKPTTGKIRDRHEDRFRVFELLQQTAQQIRALP